MWGRGEQITFLTLFSVVIMGLAMDDYTFKPSPDQDKCDILL